MRLAYKRQAPFYDRAFGAVSRKARASAVAVVNTLPGQNVLEVGVGTGLALPLYNGDKDVVGIDLSAEMLALARVRAAEQRLGFVRALLEMDAEKMAFADASFDIAVAMFTATVVPDARQLLREMRRVVRPGGVLLLVNHFMAESGPRYWVERAMTPLGRFLGWHPDMGFEHILDVPVATATRVTPLRPFGIFTLVQLANP